MIWITGCQPVAWDLGCHDLWNLRSLGSETGISWPSNSSNHQLPSSSPWLGGCILQALLIWHQVLKGMKGHMSIATFWPIWWVTMSLTDQVPVIHALHFQHSGDIGLWTYPLPTSMALSKASRSGARIFGAHPAKRPLLSVKKLRWVHANQICSCWSRPLLPHHDGMQGPHANDPPGRLCQDPPSQHIREKDSVCPEKHGPKLWRRSLCSRLYLGDALPGYRLLQAEKDPQILMKFKQNKQNNILQLEQCPGTKLTSNIAF